MPVVSVVVLSDQGGDVFLFAELRSPLPAVPARVVAFPLDEILESSPVVIPLTAEDLVDDEVFLPIHGDWWRRLWLAAIGESSGLVVGCQKAGVENRVDFHGRWQVKFNGSRGDDLGDGEGSTTPGLEFATGDGHFEVEVGGGEEDSVANMESMVASRLVGVGGLAFLSSSETLLGQLQVAAHGSGEIVGRGIVRLLCRRC